MSRSFRLSRVARTDLLQIWNYLAENASFDTADRIVRDLYAGMSKVGRSPGIGHERFDLTDEPVRFYRVHQYQIIYVPDTKPVGVVRILHSARDISSILQPDEED